MAAFDDGAFCAVAQVAAGVEQVIREFAASAMLPVSLAVKRGAKARSAARAEPAKAKHAHTSATPTTRDH